MARPQDPDDAGSPTAPTDPDPVAEVDERPAEDGRVRGVPAANQPGHHPGREQDKPDGAAFLARFRGAERSSDDAAGSAATADPERGAPPERAGP